MSTRGRRGRGTSSTTTTNGRTVNDRENGIAVEAVAPVQPRVSFATLCKEFTSLGGKPFKGTESIIEVQAWLRSCEKIFKSLDISDNQKRFMASWQLQEGAAAWWDSITASIPEDEFSWDKFKEVFEEQFMPTAGKTRLYRSFMDLKQGEMSVAEYETKFNELSRFGQGLIDTTLKKNEMFVLGMREEFQEKMTAHIKGSFVDLVDMALRYEVLVKKKPVAAATPSGGGSNQHKRKFNPNWKKQGNQKKSIGII